MAGGGERGREETSGAEPRRGMHLGKRSCCVRTLRAWRGWVLYFQFSSKPFDPLKIHLGSLIFYVSVLKM